MRPDEKQIERLFTYGTLQQEAVQLSTFGRKLAGQPDTLTGYHLVMVRIDDEDFVRESGTADHRNVQFTGDPSDAVKGIVFEVTESELEQSDGYEPSGYTRKLVQLQSGLNAWVYLQQPEPPAEDRY